MKQSMHIKCLVIVFIIEKYIYISWEIIQMYVPEQNLVFVVKHFVH